MTIDEIIARHKNRKDVGEVEKVLEDWTSDSISESSSDQEGSESSKASDTVDEDRSGGESELDEGPSDVEAGSGCDSDDPQDETSEGDEAQSEDNLRSDDDNNLQHNFSDGEKEAVKSAYFDQTIVAFEPPTQEELDKDCHGLFWIA